MHGCPNRVRYEDIVSILGFLEYMVLVSFVVTRPQNRPLFRIGIVSALYNRIVFYPIPL